MNDAHVPAGRSRRPTLFAATLAIAAGIGVDFGLLAEIQDTFGFTAAEVGLISAASFAAALFSNSVLAPLADRGWERQLILAAAITVLVSMVWMTVAAASWEWIAARCGIGLAQGMLAGAGRRLALSWDLAHQGRALADQLAAGVAGFVLGAVLGSILAEYRLDYAFLLPAGLTVVALPFVIRLRPGPLPARSAGDTTADLLRNPGVRIGVLIASSHALLLGTIDATWSRFLTDLGADLRFIGLGFLVTIGPAVVLSPFGGRWADRTNPVLLAAGALVVEMIVVAVTGFAGTPALLLLIGGGHAVVYSVFFPAALAAVAKAAPPERAAGGMALVESSTLVVAFVGAVTAPTIYESLGPRWLYIGLGAWFGMIAAITWSTRSRWHQAFEPPPPTPSGAVVADSSTVGVATSSG